MLKANQLGRGASGNPVSVTLPQPVDVTIVGGGLNFDPNMADAFGRLRVSNPQTLFDSKQVYNNQAIYFLDGLTPGHCPALAL